MRSEVFDATCNVIYIHESLWTSHANVLVTRVLLKTLHAVLVIVNWGTSGSVVLTALCAR